ncbi:MAG: 30S ribosomal protein S16 [Corynebacterium humireducens]|jgi:small subunit ribosomal protein S16|uniref:Small ribosomal subunit protein bS16 n=2 Tax=Corynebacterium humireducens TaxID=1223514 RepID=A0A0B5D3J1_9CORY|nr:30S ribosomal protein S16 [Corynebacterium humireducens]AJE33520.1 30S ribosomal protein S16 [Corynebacterium humireducens NBRC 106098 = DSM 45392]NLA57046.1 30S ribosomal protein S16 [Corynebacterium humireducens]
MAVKIKLQRIGKIRTPHYRVVIADARTRRDGKVIENIGIYEPKQEPSVIKIDSERAQYWLSVGAQPTEPVMALLKVTGDWQKFKGLEGAEGTLKVAEEKPSKLDLFNQALAEANEGPTAEAITEKKRKAKEEAEAKAAAEKEAAEKAAAEEAAKAEAEAEAAEEAPAEESSEESAE